MKTVTRRIFIASSLLAGTAFVLLPQNAKTNVKIDLFKTIATVQEVLFPKGLKAPAASEFGATAYLANVALHSSFLTSDLNFLNHGVEKLMYSYPEFLILTPLEQDRTLREFVEEDTTAKNWVSFLLYFTIEALLSDPIYGGNKNESGWKWANHNPGLPRPSKPFAEKVNEEVA
jgi:gluconate 2-dehydrogenase gamma chain